MAPQRYCCKKSLHAQHSKIHIASPFVRGAKYKNYLTVQCFLQQVVRRFSIPQFRQITGDSNFSRSFFFIFAFSQKCASRDGRACKRGGLVRKQLGVISEKGCHDSRSQAWYRQSQTYLWLAGRAKVKSERGFSGGGRARVVVKGGGACCTWTAKY